jgi:ankyrin repeat protein
MQLKAAVETSPFSVLALLPLSLAYSVQDSGAIFSAAHRGDYAAVATLVKQNAGLANATNETNQSVLHVAANSGHYEVVGLLIDSGAEVNAQQRDGRTSLHLVRNPAIASLLIDCGASLEAPDQSGLTPLQLALSDGRISVGNRIVEAGGRVDLNSAIVLGRYDLAAGMLSNTASRASALREHERVDDTFRIGRHPLHLAAHLGSLEMVKLLIANGVNVDAGVTAPNYFKLVTALSFAVWGNHIEVTRFLLECGARVDVAGGYMYPGSLVDYAVQLSDPEIIELLIVHGGRSAHNHSVLISPDPPLHMAVWSGRKEVVSLLLELGSAVTEESDGLSPLRLSILAKNAEISGILLRGGANLDIYSAAGLGRTVPLNMILAENPGLLDSPDTGAKWTPLVYAVWGNRADSVNMLLDLGAKTDKQVPYVDWSRARSRQNGRPQLHWRPQDHAAADEQTMATALGVGVQQGRVELVRKLLNAGALPYEGVLCDALSANENEEELIALLLKRSPYLNFEGLQSCMVSKVPSQEDPLAVIQLLSAHGADLNCADEKGMTLLASLVRSGARDTAQFLVGKGVEVDFVSACYLGMSDQVRAQVKSNPSLVNAPTGIPLFPTPASVAAASGSVDVLRVLGGMNANLYGLGDRAPLAVAAENGQLDVVRFLLGSELNPYSRIGAHWESVLHLAAKSNSEDMVQLFIDIGVDPNVYDARRLTPLHVAAEYGCEVAAQVLLRAGARHDQRDSFGGAALHHAAMSRTRNAVAVAQALLAAGADPQAIDFFGRTALDVARWSAQSAVERGEGLNAIIETLSK